MPIGGSRIMEGIRSGIVTDQEVAIKALFPTTDKFKMLQMITDQNSRSMMPWSVLGLFRRMYKSKVLEAIQEEYGLNKIALDRKGRLELSEVVAARRIKDDKDED